VLARHCMFLKVVALDWHDKMVDCLKYKCTTNGSFSLKRDGILISYMNELLEADWKNGDGDSSKHVGEVCKGSVRRLIVMFQRVVVISGTGV